MEKIRSFIAFPIPDDLRTKLGEAQQRIKAGLHHLRPVKPQGIHITLHFLGEISASQVYNIGPVMEKVCKNRPVIRLACRRIGAFPDMKRPRVLWAGLDGDIPQLIEFHSDLGKGLASIGFAVETQPFNPHVTLFRVKEPKQMGTLRKRVESVGRDSFGDIVCDKVVLYKSELHPQGAVYSRLNIVALG